MRAKIVRIGNSRGIRLPKPIIEQVGLEDEVEMEVRGGALVLSPIRGVRSGWSEAAKDLSAQGGDQLLDPSTPTVFEAEEWEW